MYRSPWDDIGADALLLVDDALASGRVPPLTVTTDLHVVTRTSSRPNHSSTATVRSVSTATNLTTSVLDQLHGPLGHLAVNVDIAQLGDVTTEAVIDIRRIVEG